MTEVKSLTPPRFPFPLLHILFFHSLTGYTPLSWNGHYHFERFPGSQIRSHRSHGAIRSHKQRVINGGAKIIIFNCPWSFNQNNVAPFEDLKYFD